MATFSKKPILMKPAQYAEYRIMTDILQGEYPPGSPLPNERDLAEQIGVTRPTLREILQRLSHSGFITIRQGKPTIVNDFLNDGGLGILSGLTSFGDYLPEGFVEHLLEFRNIIYPVIAKRATQLSPDKLKAYLDESKDLADTPEAFADYDWRLQLLMAKLCENPIYKMIYNDFAFIFKRVVTEFFSYKPARDGARWYYAHLLEIVDKGGEAMGNAIRQSMQMGHEMWKAVVKQKATSKKE